MALRDACSGTTSGRGTIELAVQVCQLACVLLLLPALTLAYIAWATSGEAAAAAGGGGYGAWKSPPAEGKKLQ